MPFNSIKFFSTVRDSTKIIDEQFINCLKTKRFPTFTSNLRLEDSGLKKNELNDIFHSMMLSRQFDLLARRLRPLGHSYYTIGSAGHECNAAIEVALQKSEPTIPHYRGGAYFIQRLKRFLTVDDIVYHMTNLVTLNKNDMVSGGRHRTFASKKGNIIPKTSTIGSHFPRALGLAASFNRKNLIGEEKFLENSFTAESIVLAFAGNGSYDHSTSQGSLNAAEYLVHNEYPLPLLFVCEDNEMTMSVSASPDWIKTAMKNRPYIKYFSVDGLDILSLYKITQQAAQYVRETKKPAFLHVKTKRLLGHSGAENETQYRTLNEIEEDERNDPLLHTAKICLDYSILTTDEIRDQYESIKRDIENMVVKAIKVEKISTFYDTVSPFLDPKLQISNKVPSFPTEQLRKNVFGEKYNELNKKNNMSQLLNFAHIDLMLQYPNIIVFGQDVAGKKGGIFSVTDGLEERFGSARVFNTLLDEQTTLGYALGHALNGFLPVFEAAAYRAYLRTAEDQVVGEAATLRFISNGQFSNPMVMRLPSLGYQNGFGGNWHNENTIPFLGLPDILIACPSRGDDAVKLLRTLVKEAHQRKKIGLLLEPISLYKKTDLREKDDNLQLSMYPPSESSLEIGSIRVVCREKDASLTIITYGNGVSIAEQAASTLKKQFNIPLKIIDLLWLQPLSIPALLEEIKTTEYVIIIDETKEGYSVADRLMASLNTNSPRPLNIHCITGKSGFIPYGPAMSLMFPHKNDVVDLILKLTQNIHRETHFNNLNI